ncbi:hypothetical protein SEA_DANIELLEIGNACE_65 [Arthrobacter phage DanielleIgnace]|nr:hypothetical protein SEA_DANIELLEIGNACE_65 [Arthrobacter phage DanielleIgnace]
MALTTKQIESRIAFVKDEIANAHGRVYATHGDQGPAAFAAAKSRFIAGGEARLEMLERALETAGRADLQKREAAAETREQQLAVCPVCFCKHPGEC